MTYEPMYRRIYNELLDSIQKGANPIGSRLPSEKELSDQYHVSRITTKKALEILANEGYVTRKPGKGTFVISNTAAAHPYRDDLDEEKSPQESVPPIVGVIMDGFSASFGMDLLAGLEYECRRRHFIMMVRFTYGSMENEKQAIHDLDEVGACGIILMCTQGESFNPDVLKMYLDKFPLILIDRELKGVPIPVVTTDNYGACKALTQEMIHAGYQKIGYLSHSSLQTTTVNERFEGFRDTMNANGLVADDTTCLRNLDALLPHDDDDPKAREKATVDAIRDYVERNEDIHSYIVVEYGLAVVLYRVLRDMGLGAGRAIGCFDGIRVSVGPEIPMIHVMQGQYEMGTTAVRLLNRLMRGETVTGRINIPYQMIHAGEEDNILDMS